MPSICVQITGATTTELVPAPESGSIAVWGYTLSGKNTNGTIELQSDGLRLSGAHFPSSGVAVLTQAGVSYRTEPYFLCAPQKALSAVTSAAGSVYVNLSYSVVGVGVVTVSPPEVPTTLAGKIWAFPSRTLVNGTPAAPSNRSQQIAARIWSYSTRTLTG